MTCVESIKTRMCGFADVRIFEVVKCGEILRILSADVIGKMDVMGKMRMWQCGHATHEHVPIAYLHCTFALNRLLCVSHGWA